MTATETLHPTAQAALHMLRAGVPLSRNRHFELFRDPRVRRALRMHRYLRALAAQVRAAAGELTVERVTQEGSGGWVVRVELPDVRGRRTAFLTPFELSLLAEDSPDIAARLRELAGSP
ncbi:MAG: hypothetical protein ACOYM9_13910 [Bradymonadia bacterium]